MKNKSYDNLISQLVDEFRASVDEKDNELVGAFRQYLYIAIRAFENNEYKFIKNDEETVKKNLRLLTQNMIKRDLEAKRELLVGDENLKKINQISQEIFDIARGILTKQKVNTHNIDFEEKENEIIQLLDFVRPYNKEKAKMIISETILDIKYINNPNTDIFSLRLGHINDRINYKKDDMNR